MTITLDLIQILDAIDRNGSFEAAAQELHKVRSALTYNIRTYENVTGTQIFDRSKHRAEFTIAGRVLLEQGRHLLKLSKQIEDNVKSAASGWETVIRIAYDEAMNAQPIFDLIKRFQLACPAVNLEIFSEVMGGCTHALINNYVDIVIGASGRLPQRQEYTFEMIGKVKFVFAVTPDHPLASIPEPIDSALIEKYYSVYARDSSQRFEQQASFPAIDQSTITFSSLALKKQAQIMQLGVGFLPANLITNEVHMSQLVIKEVEKPKADSVFYIGWNSENNNKAHRWLVKEILKKSFRDSLIE